MGVIQTIKNFFKRSKKWELFKPLRIFLKGADMQ